MTISSNAAESEIAEIVEAVRRRDRDQALALALAAMDRGLDHPLVLTLAAEALESRGDDRRALDVLGQVVRDAPEMAEAWRRQGVLLARMGRLAEASSALETALDIAPDVYPTLISAGAARFLLNDLKTAHDHYARARELAPREAEPPAALAAIAARRGDANQARALAARALTLDAGAISAHMAIGRADLLDDAADRSEARMTTLLERAELTPESRVGALDLRAEARDVLDRPAEAFADYQARNTILEQINRSNMTAGGGERRAEQAHRLAGFFAVAPPAPWRLRPGDDSEGRRAARGHVFLVGFPRSGTTLLEKVLAGHPDIATLEEVDCLARAGGHWLEDDAALNRLARITPIEADACREVYWRGMRETLGANTSNKIVVDKLPLHTLALPLIAKLFPDARILFALRDPRDVVFSCFRRRFRINIAMYEFLTLAGAARFYDRTMALAMIYRARLPLAVLEVRHEAMVIDLESEVRRVLRFIGVDWRPEVLDFAARARGVLNTPSDPQLARGLNADGVGQWRRYERALAPVMPLLTPWVRHFGYDA